MRPTPSTPVVDPSVGNSDSPSREKLGAPSTSLGSKPNPQRNALDLIALELRELDISGGLSRPHAQKINPPAHLCSDSEVNSDLPTGPMMTHTTSSKRNNVKEKRRRNHKRRVAYHKKLEPNGDASPKRRKNYRRKHSPTVLPQQDSVQEEPVVIPPCPGHLLPDIPVRLPSSENLANEQSNFMDSINDWRKVASTLPVGDPESEMITNAIESIFLFGYQISRADNIPDYLCASIQLIRGITHKSITNHLVDFVSHIFDESESSEILPNAGLEDAKIFWDNMKGGRIFQKISLLITASVSGICFLSSDSSWDSGILSQLAPFCAKQQISSFDLLDAIVGTFTWMWENGRECIAQKSLWPLLFEDTKTLKYTQSVDDIFAFAPRILSGNSETDLPSFENKVKDAIAKTKTMRDATPSPNVRLWLSKKYVDLIAIQDRILAKYKNSTRRFEPLGIALTGSSGVGKSTITPLIVRTSLQAMGFEPDMNRVITDDVFDKYESKMSSDVLALLMDDPDGAKKEFCQTPLSEVFIKRLNGVPAAAVKAEIEEKGVVFYNFKLVAANSNSPTFSMENFTNRPEAPLRRFFFIRVKVKKEFCIPGGVSLDKDHPSIKNNPLLDVYENDFEEVFVYIGNDGTDQFSFRKMAVEVPDRENGGNKMLKCVGLNLSQTLDVVVSLSKMHAHRQSNLDVTSEVVSRGEVCSVCSIPGILCNCKDSQLRKDCEKDLKERHAKLRQAESDAKKEKVPNAGDTPARLLPDLPFFRDLYPPEPSDEPKFSPPTKRGPYAKKVGSLIKLINFRRSLLYKTPKDCLKKLPRVQRFLRPVNHRKDVPSSGYLCGKCQKPKFRHECEFVTITKDDALTVIERLPDGKLKDQWKRHVHMIPNSLFERTFENWTSNAVDSFMTGFTKALNNYIWNLSRPAWWANKLIGYSPVGKMTTEAIRTELETTLHQTASPLLVMYTPEFIYKTSWMQRLLDYGVSSEAARNLKVYKTLVKVSMVAMALGYVRKSRAAMCYGASLCSFSSLGASIHFTALKRKYRQALMERRDLIQVEHRLIRDSKKTKYVLTGFAVGLVIIALKQWRERRRCRLANPESAFNSNDPPEERPEVKEEQPSWFAKYANKMMGLNVMPSSSSRKAQPEHLLDTFEKCNLFYAEFSGDVSCKCNVFFPMKGVVMFPAHVFDLELIDTSEKVINVKVSRNSDLCSTFSFKLARSTCVVDLQRDIAFGFVPNCPDVRDNRKFFPMSLPSGESNCTVLVRSKEDVKRYYINAKYGETGHKYADFYGASYKTPFVGTCRCMSVLVAESKTPFIAGFHLASTNAINGDGIAGTFTRSDIDSYIEKLSKKPGVLLLSQGTFIPEKQYDIDVLHKKEIHPNSHIEHMPHTSQIESYGSTKLRSVQKSHVIPSPLAKATNEVIAPEKQYGPPMLTPNWKYGFNPCVDMIADPSEHFDPVLLEKGVNDYVHGTNAKGASLASECRKQREKPLTTREAIGGVHGKDFVDSMKMATSAGFPLFGPKHKRLGFEEDSGYDVPTEPDPGVQEEMDRLMECWQSGRRGYPIFSAALKDEPVPEGSEKVRVFQMSPLAFSIQLRKYFLPILAFLSKNPTLSECAVGTNCQSKEWSKIMNHALKFSTRKAFALGWDYKKFDLRMSSQMTIAAMRILIKLAKLMGYTEEDIKIMEAMVADLVHPMIDMNGVLIMAFNMNTSGNPMTVYLNCIVNSLYTRMAFFSIYPMEKNFRDWVAIITYGDDLLGSVHSSKHGFNFNSVREFLAKHRVTITPPDKSATGDDFLTEDKADFLKRRSVYIEEIDCTVGALEIDSLWKALLCNVASRTETPKQVAISSMESVCHELFFHGRDVYDTYRPKLQQICEMSGVVVPAVFTSFEDRVSHWKSNYD